MKPFKMIHVDRLVLRIAVLAYFVLGGAGAVFSEDRRAEEIIREIDAREKSDGARLLMNMTVYQDRAAGDGKEFRLLMLTRGEDDSYTEIIEPRSVKGLRILSLGKDNWLYFPSTGRVRKIAGSSRGDSVQGIGGDFSYEDIGSGSWNSTYEFRLTSETTEAYVLEGSPRGADAVYSNVRITVDRKIMKPLKIEFSTAKDGRLKDLEFSGYRDTGGRLVARRMEMKNLRKGSRTILEILEADYSSVPADRYFNPNRFHQ